MYIFFFFNDTATTEIYTLSLHDALPICKGVLYEQEDDRLIRFRCRVGHALSAESVLAEQSEAVEDALWMALNTLEESATRSEEHTSELQSRQYLVCRLLLEKKKKT